MSSIFFIPTKIDLNFEINFYPKLYNRSINVLHLNGFFVVKISNIQFYGDSIVCFRKERVYFLDLGKV